MPALSHSQTDSLVYYIRLDAMDLEKQSLYPINDATKHAQKGLSATMVGFLIVGEIAGSGVLALPQAVEFSGEIGLVLLVVYGIVSGYTGMVLGQCWSIVQDRYPEYRGHQRYPYPALGQVCFGKAGRYAVAASIHTTLFGAGVVFLILASQNIQDLLATVAPAMSFCYWQPVIMLLLFLFVLLGSPKDFWPLAFGAATATGIACIILTANVIIDVPLHHTVTHPPATWFSMASAFGTMTWAFCGHPAYPSFQTDMKDHSKFHKAIFVGYVVVFAMYIPVAATGYFLLGGSIKSNILESLSPGGMRTTITVLITLHLLFAFVIVANPVCQELEELFNISRKFSLKRVASRGVMVLVVLFVAESLPHFGVLLSLVGGSTTCLLSYIFPSLFYLRLSRMEGNWTKIQLSLPTKVINWEIIAVGVVAGIASTYSAIQDLVAPGAFTLPCYINATAANGS